MSELIRVPGVLGIHNNEHDLGDSVMSALVEADKLPSDFQVRLLAIADNEERERVGTQDVLAALGYDTGTGLPYLTEELPDCILFTPYSPPLRPIISQIETDYHIFYDMRAAAEKVGLMNHLAWSAWALYIRHLDPDLHASISDFSNAKRKYTETERRSLYFSSLGRIALRDDALYDIYESIGNLKGHGKARTKILHQLLLDNHPEIGPEAK